MTWFNDLLPDGAVNYHSVRAISLNTRKNSDKTRFNLW